jgi:hypothetical protein
MYFTKIFTPKRPSIRNHPYFLCWGLRCHWINDIENLSEPIFLFCLRWFGVCTRIEVLGKPVLVAMVSCRERRPVAAYVIVHIHGTIFHSIRQVHGCPVRSKHDMNSSFCWPIRLSRIQPSDRVGEQAAVRWVLIWSIGHTYLVAVESLVWILGHYLLRPWPG